MLLMISLSLLENTSQNKNNDLLSLSWVYFENAQIILTRNHRIAKFRYYPYIQGLFFNGTKKN